jgi:hypothetical protein
MFVQLTRTLPNGCAQSVLLYQVLHVAGNIGRHLLAPINDLIEKTLHVCV